MEIESLDLNIEKLNEYFHFYKTEADYAESVRIVLEATGLPITQSYKDNICSSKKWIENQAKHLQVDIDFTVFEQLLEKYNLKEKQDEILFAFVRFKNSFNSEPNNELQDHTAYVNQNREYWKVLKYILQLKGTIGNSQIKIYKGKGLSNAVTIKDPEIVYDFLKYAKEYIAGKLEYYDEETNSVLSSEKFSVELVDRIINSFRKGDPGKKPGKDLQRAIFINRFLHYLNNETTMKAKHGKISSSIQCLFIFELFSIFGVLDDKRINALPEEGIAYIIMLIENNKNNIKFFRQK